MGEEGGSEDGTSGLDWVVDPLDGTVNFLFGIPQWCVSVAVRDGEGNAGGRGVRPEPRGAVHGDARRPGATLNGPDGEVELTGPRRGEAVGVQGVEPGGELATAMVATGLAYDARVRAAQARVLARAIPEVRDIRRFGSAALDLAWTAAGRFDAYFERTVKPWDIAAGALVCERAGSARAGLARARGSAVRNPRRAAGARRAAAGAGWRPGVGANRCGGWESNPHALADRGF